MIEQNLGLPFETTLLCVAVSVTKVDVTQRDEIVAVCRRGKARQVVSILDLPLPEPRLPEPNGLRPIGAGSELEFDGRCPLCKMLESRVPATARLSGEMKDSDRLQEVENKLDQALATIDAMRAEIAELRARHGDVPVALPSLTTASATISGGSTRHGTVIGSRQGRPLQKAVPRPRRRVRVSLEEPRRQVWLGRALAGTPSRVTAWPACVDAS